MWDSAVPNLIQEKHACEITSLPSKDYNNYAVTQCPSEGHSCHFMVYKKVEEIMLCVSWKACIKSWTKSYLLQTANQTLGKSFLRV